MTSPRSLPGSRRLKSKKEIDEIFKQGRYAKLGWLQAKFSPGRETKSRFMVSVRKAVGNAPERNRIRRVVKEAIRLHQDELSGGYDVCFFITHRSKEPVRLSTVESEIQKFFNDLSKR